MLARAWLGAGLLCLTTLVQADPSLIAHWKLDDTSTVNAVDASGNNQTASLVNTPTPISGRVNGAYAFDGSNQALVLNNLAGLNAGNTPHTVAAWLKVNNLPSNRAWLLLLGNEGQGAHHWLLSSNGQTQFGVWSGGQTQPALGLGVWRHIATSFDGATYKLYVDGNESASVAASFAFSGMPLTLAQPHVSENGFDGALDDVRVYTRSLSAAEIATLANPSIINQPPSVNLTSPANGASYTPLATIPLTATASDADGSVTRVEFYNGTSLIATDSNASDGWGVTWSGVPAGTYSLSAKAFDNAGASTASASVSISVAANSNGVPSAGLLAYYPFDEANGSVANDASGNNQHAALSNAPTWGAGRINGALFFDGIDDGLSLASLTGLNPGNTPHTLSAWVKVNSYPSQRAWLLQLGNEGSGSHHWLLGSNGSTQLGVWSGTQASPTLPLGQWQHLTLSFDGTTLSTYINGTLSTSAAAAFNFSGMPLTLASAHFGENYFSGALDELRIYNRPLNSAEAAALAGAPSSNQPPSVSLTAPANGTSYSAPATIPLTATTSDADGTVTKVEFYNGTSLIATDSNASDGWSISWNTVPAGSYSLSAKAFDSGGASTASASVSISVTAASAIEPGLLAYWKLDESSGSSAADASGNNQTASLINAPSWTPGKLNGALTFNGNDQALSLNNVAGLSSSNNAHTVAAWVKVNSLPPTRAWMLLLGNEGTGSHHWLLLPDGRTQLGSWAGTQVQPTLVVGQWQHIALSFDGSMLTGYLNGSAIGTAAAGFNLLGPLSVAQAHVSENAFNGQFDEIRLYNRGLTASEIATLANVPNAQPASKLHYIYADHLNTPRVITDTGNKILWRNDQADPFGTTLPNEDADNNGVKFEFNLRFPGQYFDQETGLHYNMGRDYDPGTGRYVQPDPLGLHGGDVSLYVYGKSNPLSFTDPMGLQAIPAPTPPLGFPAPWNPKSGNSGDGLFDPPAKSGGTFPWPTWLMPKSALEECEQDCDAGLERDYAYCKALGATYNDYRTRKACEERAFSKYVQCLKQCKEKCK